MARHARSDPDPEDHETGSYGTGSVPPGGGAERRRGTVYGSPRVVDPEPRPGPVRGTGDGRSAGRRVDGEPWREPTPPRGLPPRREPTPPRGLPPRREPTPPRGLPTAPRGRVYGRGAEPAPPPPSSFLDDDPYDRDPFDPARSHTDPRGRAVRDASTTGSGRTVAPGRGRTGRPSSGGRLRAQADLLLAAPASTLIGAVSAVLALAVLVLVLLALLTSAVFGGDLGDQAVGVLLWAVAVPVVGLVWYHSRGPHRALLTLGAVVVALGVVFAAGLLVSGWSTLAADMAIAAAGSLAFITVWAFLGRSPRRSA